ncbi:30S ribosomal protein S18 [Candidatus Amesbacteria bacterium RIFCSPHIGHO2_02_FULL_47_9]|uniref:Small ribosomal subunit protein bS18 n=1 Tax=Candidatus Amesbacteria bacterium RIFCSPHIGHO2_01_FULL_48_32b TaxID=1797253 RepID=A0A1F4YD14_9BACT|nr:MAG: 30S ribosomal protein S18 [Candidatus Amesbacteria bacterium RIFCSPHIGHO2_01_FULL_48_32b]OGD04276.1 MAG: 30S ribosomal protein S18 [Candidatus Amesbacteria bacterium RIFCSPHIGHO2_02_FULL_47_9]OGD08218.1 MAG: 30S ribosomal protein S18 [Candidatus Amesbacteria bacterium RIFCSPLOWO2_01_FULL_49_25]
MQKKRIIKVPRNCQFCKEKKEPEYKDVATLSKYVSDRGRILGKNRTGVCAKHQRKLAKAIKRAREVALLPFVAGL